MWNFLSGWDLFYFIYNTSYYLVLKTKIFTTTGMGAFGLLEGRDFTEKGTEAGLDLQ